MAKTILITGASTGIGRATAIYFAEKGWDVAATMRDPAKADSSLKHPQITLFTLDVTDEHTITSAIAAVLGRYQKIDVLLNNAGYGLLGPIEAISREQLHQQFATNVFGLISVTQHVLPVTRSAGGGLIMNVASIGGRIAFPFTAAYHATKFAVEGLSESMRYELAPFNIRVKVMEPGGTHTDFATRSMAIAVSDPYRASMNKIMAMFAKMGLKLPKPDAVAKVIYRAANDSSNRLRYLAKPGPFILIHRVLPDAVWRWVMGQAIKAA
jgi:NAD(P)-dependent dehydrogenase (short-subunit alcohol dehydrogenase family)